MRYLLLEPVRKQEDIGKKCCLNEHFYRGILSIMILIGNGMCDQSLNPGQGFGHFTQY